jgi:integrase
VFFSPVSPNQIAILKSSPCMTAIRIVRVAEWAWPYVEERCRDLRPNDLLFPDIDRWQARDAHVDGCTRAEIEDYQLRDQRHSYAVRAARAGAPAELIARQLGHANAVLVLKVYGRFMPSQQDRDKWEKLADLQDRASEARGTVRGYNASKQHHIRRSNSFSHQ